VGTATGLLLALSLIIPDLVPPDPEQVVYFILWIWCCFTIGLSVNAAVQLLLSPGDPLMLLRRELDTRLLAVEQTLRCWAGSVPVKDPPAPLDTLGIAGMTRPLALLKSASMIHRWARMRHERLTAIITLVDRLVTSAIALETVAPFSDNEIHRERLLKVADACDRTRRAFAELRLPSASEWIALSAQPVSGAMSPLADMERTLDEITLAVPGRSEDSGESGGESAEKLRLFLPDAFTNPEHVHFAIKGALAAFICYVLFVGFDYRGIYTSVITCFVVALSTIGASNQKGILRFGGAAVGGAMAMIALAYLFPNTETIGGFWLVLGAATVVAAWVNFGTPRISYGGYQIGLAFYKAVFQGFGPVSTSTVIRDRLVGVFFGLTVFGIVEHLLWPVRAADALRKGLVEIIHLVAELARTVTSRSMAAVTDSDVDLWRRRISQKVEKVQELIESSKFELGASNLNEIQKLTGNAQIIFILLLSLARQRADATYSNRVRAAAVELDDAMARVLLALETHVAGSAQPTVPNLEAMTGALEGYIDATRNVPDEAAVEHLLIERLAYYRALVAAIKRVSSLEYPSR